MGFLIFDDAFAVATESKPRRVDADDTRGGFWEAGVVSLFAGVRDTSRKIQSLSTSRRQYELAPEYRVADAGAKDRYPDPGRVGSRFQDISELESRLWSEAERRVSPDAGQGRICVMGFDKSDSDTMIAYLESAALSPNAFSAGIHEILDIAAIHETVSMLVVNGDAFGDLFSAVDALKSFREIRPHMSVVLVSSKVASDDLSADRKAICDATLRAPVTMARLHVAVKTTVENKDERTSQAKKKIPSTGGKILMFRRGTERRALATS